MDGFWDHIVAGKKIRRGKDYPYFIEDGVLYFGYWTTNQMNKASKMVAGYVVDGEAIAYHDYDEIKYELSDVSLFDVDLDELIF
jgi:hypothetical protein